MSSQKTDFIRASCEIFADTRHKPLSHITLVGALASSKEKTNVKWGNLGDFDLNYLWRTLDELKERRVSVDPNFTADVCNIAYGDDFLTSKNPTDIVIVCWVNAGMVESFMSSPQQDMLGVWSDTALRVGAKVVAAYGASSSEITTYNFRSKGQEQLYVPFDPTASYQLLRHKDFHCPHPA